MKKILVADNLEILAQKDILQSDAYYTRDVNNAEDILESLCEEGYDVLYLTEKIAKATESKIEDIRKRTACEILTVRNTP